MPGFVLCRFYHGDSCWFNEVQQIIETWWGCFSHGMDVRSSGFPCLCRNDASPGRWESSCAACLAIRDQQEETQQSSKRLFKNKNSINKLQIWMRPSWGIRLEPTSMRSNFGYPSPQLIKCVWNRWPHIKTLPYFCFAWVCISSPTVASLHLNVSFWWIAPCWYVMLPTWSCSQHGTHKGCWLRGQILCGGLCCPKSVGF
jgi:hypothetical protein